MEELFKIILIGNQNVGKTCLMQRFTKNATTDNSIPTVGVEFATKTIHLDNTDIKCQIWDTAGQ